MSAYTEIFTATVPVVGGCLAPEIKEWFASSGDPVVSEGDRIMVAEGINWEAFTGVRVVTGTFPLKFRFRNKGLALQFKLTWHAV